MTNRLIKFDCPSGFTGIQYEINNDNFHNHGYLENLSDNILTLTKFLLNFSDIDECISNPCDTNATCNNYMGSYSCTCNYGYTGDETTCTGIICRMIYNKAKFYCQSGFTEIQCEIMFCLY